MRVYEVGDRLYVSAFPRERDVPKLRELGVDAVFTFSRKAVRPQLASDITRGGPALYWPLVDGKHPDDVAVDDSVAGVSDYLLVGRTCLLHCLAGRNRSAAVAALVEARRQGWTGAEALAHIREVRPNSIHNPAYEELILRSDAGRLTST